MLLSYLCVSLAGNSVPCVKVAESWSLSLWLNHSGLEHGTPRTPSIEFQQNISTISKQVISNRYNIKLNTIK
jgi:hypothetical protein